MKQEIPLPYSQDTITVQTERIAALFDLPIIRITIREQRTALTSEAAKELGQALIHAAIALERPDTDASITHP